EDLMAALPGMRSLLLGTLGALQAADFVLTWLLVSGQVHQDVYEANPLANAVLARAGWLGLAAFKLGCAGLALGTALLVWRLRAAVWRASSAWPCSWWWATASSCWPAATAGTTAPWSGA